MRRAISMGIVTMIALCSAACFNTNTFEESHHGGKSYEHVIVQYTLQSGDAIERTAEGGVPLRKLTVMPSLVIIEDDEGGVRLLPLEHVLRLEWRPNPDAPVEDEET